VSKFRITITRNSPSSLRRFRIEISPSEAFFWIGDFISNTPDLELTTDTLNTLVESLVTKQKWGRNHDDTGIIINPETKIVTAYNSFVKISPETSSNMPVDDFIHLLWVWIHTLSDMDEQQN